MTKMSPADLAAIDRMLSDERAVVAARLFVTTFAAGQSAVMRFHRIRASLRSMYGLKSSAFTTFNEPSADPVYGLATECALRWERALLAVREGESGDGNARVRVLPTGTLLLNTADPYAAVLETLRGGTSCR